MYARCHPTDAFPRILRLIPAPSALSILPLTSPARHRQSLDATIRYEVVFVRMEQVRENAEENGRDKKETKEKIEVHHMIKTHDIS